MSVPIYSYPPETEFQRDIPVFLNFYCALWSTFNSARTRYAIENGTQFVVTLPYPRQYNTANTQNYSAGNMLNVYNVETGNVTGLLGQQLTATAELAESFLYGGSVIRFDHFETILEPGARRTHVFDINLVAKTKAQSERANNIALIFQTNVFPLAATQSLLTMLHPPIWWWYADTLQESLVEPGSPFHGQYWDGDPLPSVLKSVDINRSPILNTPFATPNFKPLAINIKLQFIELEPAMQPGNGAVSLLSRAERFNRGGGRPQLFIKP
jgi:hypothetical protein